MDTRLWLLRHGDAEPHGSKPDEQRELTPKGREEALWAGKAVAALGAPTLVLASPRVRATQTAQIAAAELGIAPVMEETLSSGLTGEGALELVLRHPGETLLLVGHMPDMAFIVGDLASSRVGFRTGGLAELRGSGTSWELTTLLKPREAKAIAGLTPNGRLV